MTWVSNAGVIPLAHSSVCLGKGAWRRGQVEGRENESLHYIQYCVKRGRGRCESLLLGLWAFAASFARPHPYGDNVTRNIRPNNTCPHPIFATYIFNPTFANLSNL